MNTHRLAVMLLGLLLHACSNSGDGPSIPPAVDEGVQTQYSLILSNGTSITASSFDANALEMGPAGLTPLQPLEIPQFTYRDVNSFSFLRQLQDCGSEVHYWDADAATTLSLEVFGKSMDCIRELLALAHSKKTAYIAFSLQGESPETKRFYLKSVAFDENEPGFDEIELDKEPRQLLWSSGKLFVLGYDKVAGKNTLLILDGTSGSPVNELDLGPNVLKILKNSVGDLLVSYESRHLVIDALTFEVNSRVQYVSGKEPNFSGSESNYFDPAGTLYYSMPTGQNNTEYDHIPGVYDFGAHTAYLYYFENFLTPERRSLYAIGDTRGVGFDHHNGLMLIGYQNANNANRGGVIRIKPVPEPKFVDQLSLEAVPLYIIVH